MGFSILQAASCSQFNKVRHTNLPMSVHWRECVHQRSFCSLLCSDQLSALCAILESGCLVIQLKQNLPTPVYLRLAMP